jgi:hypothetical protein
MSYVWKKLIMRFYKVFAFVISTALAFLAFTAIALGLQATGLVSAPSSTSLSRVDTEEQAWRALGIDDYQITLQFSRARDSFAATITVYDGVDTGCTVEHPHIVMNGLHVNDECDLMSDLTDSVSALFNRVRTLPVIAQNLQAEVTPEIDYDATYHFPIRIVFNPTIIEDVGFVSEVIAFEPLP